MEQQIKKSKVLKALADKTLRRFILVGIINTLVGSGIMFLFYNAFHFGYWFSSASNYIVGSIVSFFLNKYYTFESRRKSWKEVLLFVLNIAVCWLLAYGIAKPLVLLALKSLSPSIQDNVALLVGMCVFVGLNYLGQRFIVFSHR